MYILNYLYIFLSSNYISLLLMYFTYVYFNKKYPLLVLYMTWGVGTDRGIPHLSFKLLTLKIYKILSVFLKFNVKNSPKLDPLTYHHFYITNKDNYKVTEC